MIHMQPIQLSKGVAIGVLLELPKTRVLSISTERGYVMGGTLDVAILDRLHPERGILAARVTGVREIEDILTARVQDCTRAATELGVTPGMTGRDALEHML
jgi:uncharacterized protein YunC (DUF1805 family)